MSLDVDDLLTIRRLVRDAIGVSAGVQAYDADLTAIAALSSAADKVPYATGAQAWALADFTAAGRALVDDASATAQIATLSGVLTALVAVMSATGTAAAQRAALGLDTGNSPQFNTIEVGSASDTTLSRAGAGDLAVEGKGIYRADGTDVPVVDGGTGASTAAGARSNLGLAIGSAVEAWDADLDAVAALAATAGMLSRTGAGAFAARTLTAPAAGITIANGTGAAGDPTLSLANDLSAVEGISTTGIAVRTASETWVTRTLVEGSNITITNPAGIAGNITIAASGGGSSTLAGLTDVAAQTVSQIPNTDNNIDLGSSTKSWANIYANVGFYIKNQKHQSFVVEIRNVSAAINHRIINDTENAAASNFSGQITGASATRNVTPTGTDSSTDFTTGVKISSASTNRLIFNTAAQTAADLIAAGVNSEYDDILLGVTIEVTTQSRNVNGTTRIRMEWVFNNPTTGAAVAINTTNWGLNLSTLHRYHGFLA